MKQQGLVSNYTVSQFKPHRANCNEDRLFDQQPYLNVVVSDLTYVRVGNRQHYFGVLVDLFNREIIGYSSGQNKDEALVKKAFNTVNVNLN